VFRWPISLTPLSLASDGTPREAVLEITPRAAAFTLAALSHVGHAAHLALVDAYLKGQVRLTETAEIGQDSRTVAASLAAPVLAAAELGVDRLTLADLILLPRDLKASDDAERSASGQPARTPDCARMLLRAGNGWHWVRGAERFEQAGCLGTIRVGVGEPWYDVIVELPEATQVEASGRAGRWPAPIKAEVRAPSLPALALDAELLSAPRTLALGRFGRSARLVDRALDVDLAAEPGSPFFPIARADLRAERLSRKQVYATSEVPEASAADAGSTLVDYVGLTWPVLTSFRQHDLIVEVALVPDLDGYSTLCLLPPADADPASIVPPMLDATRSVVEALIGRPLAEHRADPIALTLRLERGGQERTTTLAIGESIVIVRNQVVFTAWVGSDGRAMLKLFPPGGMHPD